MASGFDPTLEFIHGNPAEVMSARVKELDAQFLIGGTVSRSFSVRKAAPRAAFLTKVPQKGPKLSDPRAIATEIASSKAMSAMTTPPRAVRQRV